MGQLECRMIANVEVFERKIYQMVLVGEWDFNVCIFLPSDDTETNSVPIAARGGDSMNLLDSIDSVDGSF